MVLENSGISGCGTAGRDDVVADRVIVGEIEIDPAELGLERTEAIGGKPDVVVIEDVVADAAAGVVKYNAGVEGGKGNAGDGIVADILKIESKAAMIDGGVGAGEANERRADIPFTALAEPIDDQRAGYDWKLVYQWDDVPD